MKVNNRSSESSFEKVEVCFPVPHYAPFYCGDELTQKYPSAAIETLSFITRFTFVVVGFFRLKLINGDLKL